jgi:hypothetical protein
MDGAAQKQETRVGNLWRLEKTWVGWVGTCSKRFDDYNKDNN